jgi:hypothetical protein
MSQKQADEHKGPGKGSNLVVDRHEVLSVIGPAKLHRKKRYDNHNKRHAGAALLAEGF